MNTKILILLLVSIIIIGGCTNLGYRSQELVDEAPPIYDEYPSVTTNLNPSNPSLDESFTLTVTAEDDNGIRDLTWESSKPFANHYGKSGFSDCNLQKSCSYTWEFIPLEEGLYQFTVFVVDSSGQELRNEDLEVNVQPVIATTLGSNDTGVTDNGETEVFFTCGNGVCEGGESYESCSEDCDLDDIVGTSCGDGACEPGEDADYCPRDCEVINPNCGNGVCNEGETRDTCYADCENGSAGPCNSNYDCDDEQICSDGVCIDVDCRTDADCSGCRRCSYNSCVNCPQGPYGCSC